MIDHGSDRIPAEEVVPLCVGAALVVLMGVIPGLYGIVDADPDLVLRFAGFSWALILTNWLAAFLRRHGRALPLDAPMFMYAVWWAMVPYYLFRISGRKAWLPMLAFLFLWGGSYGVGLVFYNVATW